MPKADLTLFAMVVRPPKMDIARSPCWQGFRLCHDLPSIERDEKS
jgi:hypothetical protein